MSFTLLLIRNMGQGAETGRRALIEHVTQCVEHTNVALAAWRELQAAHNTLVEQTRTDVTGLKQKVDTHALWLAKLETDLDGQKVTATRLGMAVQLLETRDKAFAGMTFWQRLRWLLTGACTRPPITPAVPMVTVVTPPPPRARVLEMNRLMTNEAPSFGRASAGMAPRPLP